MSIHTLSDAVRYRLLKYLAAHPEASQRELARELGISLGKVNYCLKALMEKGWLKVRNFSNSTHKSAYAYILTPKGIDEKVNVTRSFLRHRVEEYDLLLKEIAALSAEVEGMKEQGTV
jgi:MarR family transcriptional regulator, temperature-dependent positive regulator of motility